MFSKRKKVDALKLKNWKTKWGRHQQIFLFLIFFQIRNLYCLTFEYIKKLPWNQRVSFEMKVGVVGGKNVACWRIFYHFPADGESLPLTSYSIVLKRIELDMAPCCVWWGKGWTVPLCVFRRIPSSRVSSRAGEWDWRACRWRCGNMTISSREWPSRFSWMGGRRRICTWWTGWTARGRIATFSSINFGMSWRIRRRWRGSCWRRRLARPFDVFQVLASFVVSEADDLLRIPRSWINKQNLTWIFYISKKKQKKINNTIDSFILSRVPHLQ